MSRLPGPIHAILSYFVLLIGWLWANYIFRVRNRVEIVGRENLPKGVRILYTSNHRTLIDSFLIGVAVIPLRDILFNQRRVPWNTPDYNNFFSHPVGKHVVSLLKNIPTMRGVRDRQLIADQFNAWTRALNDSNLLMFFEGTRSRDGNIGACRSGIARLVTQAIPCYLVPMYLDDSVGKIMPLSSGYDFRRGISKGQRAKIIIGKPIAIDSLLDQLATRTDLCRRIRDEVVALQARA